MDREAYGPEFDDRLIKLVKENPAIYDVSHPNYRRTPVRMAIWEKLAAELEAPSRFLQTKWKNIRYNYLLEQKSLETGIANTNIRKRRSTEDLSFLKYTAYRRDSNTNTTKFNFNESEDSNSYMYPDNLAPAGNTYEVIELDHSEDEDEQFLPDVSAFLAPMSDTAQNSPQDPYGQPDNPEEASGIKEKNETKSEQQFIPKTTRNSNCLNSPTNSRDSSRSSPLLAPIIAAAESAKNGNEIPAIRNGHHQLYSEVTIQPLNAASPLKRQINILSNDQTSLNSAKRRTTWGTSNCDPIELYCLSLVDCFRAMPRSERERVKFEFSKILKDAHYKDQL